MDTVDRGAEPRDRRAALLVSTWGKRPNLSIPAAGLGRAELKAASGFFGSGSACNVRLDDLAWAWERFGPETRIGRS